MGDGYDVAVFPCGLVAGLVAMAYLKVRVRSRYEGSGR